MRVVFGLGLWWLTLGMIASIVTRYRPPSLSEVPIGLTSRVSGDRVVPRDPLGQLDRA
jgi:hypothetical protein